MARPKNDTRVPAGLQEMTYHGVLPEDLTRVQTESSGQEPEPEVVMLIREVEPGSRPLPGQKPQYQDKPPVAPIAKPSPTPRCIHQNERAPEGLVRYKIRALAFGEQPTRYILVAAEPDAEQTAREHYLRSTGLRALIQQLQADGIEPEKVRLSVRRLAD